MSNSKLAWTQALVEDKALVFLPFTPLAVVGHAYGVTSVRLIHGLRMIRLRNPWFGSFICRRCLTSTGVSTSGTVRGATQVMNGTRLTRPNGIKLGLKSLKMESSG